MTENTAKYNASLASSEYAVEMLHITKIFNDHAVLEDINLGLKQGEIHALLGENGSGKTTLMRILFGMYVPDGGEIKINGQQVQIKNPNEASALRIGMVHQHFELVDVFTVLENIVLGAEDTHGGFISMDKARAKVENLIARYGLAVDLDSKVEDLSVGAQQRVEILKMLYRDNDILIFDEPTAVLTPVETGELLEIMRNLRQEGKSLLFISHKLEELMAVSDRVTIIRKGRYIGTVNTCDTDENRLSEMMVGRPVKLKVDKEPSKPGEIVLEVKNLSVASAVPKRDAVRNASFKVRAGEIVCIAGISGNGQTELVEALTGLTKVKSGTIIMNGTDVTDKNVSTKSLNLSHIPEDRHKHGLALEFSLGENLIMRRYKEKTYQHLGMIRRRSVNRFGQKIIEENDVRCGRGTNTIVKGMSGGNQQKAIIGRELDMDRKLIIAVQPTRGVDVGAIESIHKRLVEERDAGKAVLVVSVELSEVMNLSDRIMVMNEGEIVGVLDPKKTSMEEIGLYMSGARKDCMEDEE